MNEYNYFGFQKLNKLGQEKAVKIQQIFEQMLNDLEPLLTHPRASAVCLTKLEEACFFAKKSMALDPNNQVDDSQPELPLENS
jgi:hypothetical protein